MPESVILARGRCAFGAVWYHVAAREGRSCWWMCGSSQGGIQILGRAEAVVAVHFPQFVENVEVPQTQFFDRVVQLLQRDRYTVQTVQNSLRSRCSSWTGWDTRCFTTMLGFDTAENCGSSAVAVLLTRCTISLLCRSSCGLRVPQIQFIARAGL